MDLEISIEKNEMLEERITWLEAQITELKKLVISFHTQNATLQKKLDAKSKEMTRLQLRINVFEATSIPSKFKGEEIKICG